MTRKDLQEKYNIIGENKDIMLFRKGEDKGTGIGYAGNISLVRGSAVFNGEKYATINALDHALREWGEGLEYPVDSYCPMYNETWRTESRIIWYLRDKLGFKQVTRNWEMVYEKPIGPSFNLEFFIGKELDEGKIGITSKYGPYIYRNSVDNAEDGIASINTIVSVSVSEMAKDMIEIISVCPVGVSDTIEAYVPSKRNILGFEKVDFKTMMIQRLEEQLKVLKGE